MGGCVYTKDDEEYCFMNVPMDKAAEVECDATSGGPGGGEATSPQAGPTGTGTGETAGPGEPSAGPGTSAGTGAGTAGPGTDAGTEAPTDGQGTGEGTGVPGATTAQGAEATTAGDPSSRGQKAQEEKEKATEEKEEAEATVAAAQETATKAAEVGDKIDKVVEAASGSSATTPAGGRVRRQATTGIPTFTVPSTCASFQSMVSEMNDQIALKTVTGLQTASNIGTALIAVDPNDISCSADDVAALNKAKEEVTAAAEVVATVIVIQQNVIMEAIETINKAIETIKQVNEELIELGQTAFADPGTTLAPVTEPPLPTQGPTEGPESATTAGGVDGATTAGGVDEATTAGAAESSPPMISTANPSRRKFFGKRSRGSIL